MTINYLLFPGATDAFAEIKELGFVIQQSAIDTSRHDRQINSFKRTRSILQWSKHSSCSKFYSLSFDIANHFDDFNIFIFISF